MTKVKRPDASFPSREALEQSARELLVEGDLFTFKCPVIPIMTRGRAYGSISKRVQGQGVRIPELALSTAAFVPPYIFLALWDDTAGYSPERIAQCAGSCLRVAALDAKIELLAMPVLGGKEGFKYLWAAEKGLLQQADVLDRLGVDVPDHRYVTDRIQI